MNMFDDREDAGRQLVQAILKDKIKADFVLSIPRGGVVVGALVAKKLQIPHSLIIIKKIGVPQNPELALGAVEGGGMVFWDKELIEELGITIAQKKELLKIKEKELQERVEKFKIKSPRVIGKTVLVVDDGVATGSTARIAALVLRKKGAKKIILATPVIARETAKSLFGVYEVIISLIIPKDFNAVGAFYRNFPQVSDQEVLKIMK